MTEIALNEVMTDPDAWRCPDCGRTLTRCTTGPLLLACLFHRRPLYFRIDHNDAVVDFRVRSPEGE